MGISSSYRRITPEEFATLLEDPEKAQSFFGLDPDEFGLECDYSSPEDDDLYFSLEKEGYALHFLLTGDANLKANAHVPTTQWNVVIGGTPTIFPATYDFVRYLKPEEVNDVAEFLGGISANELRKRFDAEAFNAAGIPPGAWDEDEISYLLDVLYPGLVEFFQNAAESEDIILLSSD
jgi:Domain of unknown function (DUF1877)